LVVAEGFKGADKVDKIEVFRGQGVRLAEQVSGPLRKNGMRRITLSGGPFPALINFSIGTSSELTLYWKIF
ncbi:MAG: hypothetical protein D3912_14790, partial [Candidatus Electrothrix sp. AX1]|nr:hypothetical protein [Candidatus Electrothrix sp. AX1]